MKELQQTALPRPQLVALVLLLCLAAAPHALNLALPIVGFFFLVAGIRLLLIHRQWRLPGGAIKGLLVVLGTLNVWLNYHTLTGQNGGTALLTVMLGLKLLEVKARRDLYLTLFLAFFLIITQFLFDQSIFLTLYALLVTTGLVALMVEMNRLHPSTSIWIPLRQALILLGQAVPMLVVLFLLFPRIDAPLWRMKSDTQGATGLSDRMSPGSIAELSRNPQVAFRVRFDGPPAPPEQRYWRGPVFLETDGREWSANRLSPIQSAHFTPLGPATSYTVNLEPARHRWLPALELPAAAPDGARLTADYQVIADSDLSHGRQYRIQSHPTYRNDYLLPGERAAALRLPANVTPRMRALVAEWRNAGSGDEAVVRAALLMFNRDNFVYTLNPPLLGASPADQFLFQTKQGFCEHYATSFVLLMRIAGIPARVVTGYQGGEFNDMGRYLIVRQSDAHAWSEVWLERQGWIRVDPTAAVSPERVHWSYDFKESALSQLLLSVPRPALESSTLTYLTARVRLTLDAIDMAWGEWFLGFDSTAQAALLAEMGLDLLQRREMMLGMAALVVGLMTATALSLMRRDRIRKSKVQRSYDRFCRLLRRYGVDRRPWEGPRAFGERAAKALPARAPAILHATDLYIRLRYGGEGGVALGQALAKAVSEVRRRSATVDPAQPSAWR